MTRTRTFDYILAWWTLYFILTWDEVNCMSEENKALANPQKYSWSIVKTYDTYNEANAHRTSLLNKGRKKEEVKVNRRGVGGHQFAVKVAKLIKKSKEEISEES